jgi:hypothetical protein
MRHVGKIANTDQKCVVVFMQIPNAEDNALVVATDNLPMRMEQAIMDHLRSAEGQQTENFYEVLSRYRMPDTGDTILAALHNQGKLQKVPVHNVLMLPEPNRPVNLAFILENWPSGNRLKKNTDTHMLNNWEPPKYNQHLANQEANTTENQKMMARNIMIEAEMLEADARKKREMAYSYDPSLRAMHQAKSSHPIMDEMLKPAVNYGMEMPSMYDAPKEVVPVMSKDNVLEDRLSRLETAMLGFMERMEAPKELPEPKEDFQAS